MSSRWAASRRPTPGLGVQLVGVSDRPGIVAKVFGESSALKSLQQGEEHGLDDYEDALEDEDVMPGCKDMIRSELLARSRQHIATLQGLADRR